MESDTPVDLGRECASCGAEFRPRRPWQLYCSRGCQQQGYASRSVRVRLGPVKMEALVKRIVDQVMEELRQGEW